MDEPDVQRQWRELRALLTDRAEKMKDSQSVVFELERAYAELAPTARPRVDEVLIEWALSDDELLRFDALYVIEEHSVASAVPALLRLHSRLEDESKRPGAPFEAAKVARILERLSTR